MMNKYAILLGVLLVAGISFAELFPHPDGDDIIIRPWPPRPPPFPPVPNVPWDPFLYKMNDNAQCMVTRHIQLLQNAQGYCPSPPSYLQDYIDALGSESSTLSDLSLEGNSCCILFGIVRQTCIQWDRQCLHDARQAFKNEMRQNANPLFHDSMLAYRLAVSYALLNCGTSKDDVNSGYSGTYLAYQSCIGRLD